MGHYGLTRSVRVMGALSFISGLLPEASCLKYAERKANNINFFMLDEAMTELFDK
jgi:hypothetical protein